jgi:hypothetical protein
MKNGTSLTAIALMLLVSAQVSAHAPTIVSPMFKVCAQSLPGVTYHVTDGLDAAGGAAHRGRASIDIMIGRTLDRPPGMKRYDPSQTLPDAITPLDESTGANGRGKAKLLGFGFGMVRNVGPKPFQDQVFIVLTAADGAANTALLNQVNSALVRCPIEKRKAKVSQ